jgi:hypothetical protein
MVHLVLLSFIVHQGAHQVLVLEMNQQTNFTPPPERLLPLEVEVIHPVSCTHLHVVLSATVTDQLVEMPLAYILHRELLQQTDLEIVHQQNSILHQELHQQMVKEQNLYCKSILLLSQQVETVQVQSLLLVFIHHHVLLLLLETEQLEMGQMDFIFLQELHQNLEMETNQHLDCTLHLEPLNLLALVHQQTRYDLMPRARQQQMVLVQPTVMQQDCTFLLGLHLLVELQRNLHKSESSEQRKQKMGHHPNRQLGSTCQLEQLVLRQTVMVWQQASTLLHEVELLMEMELLVMEQQIFT